MTTALFEGKIDDLLGQFRDDFKSWVADFDQFTERRHVAAAISNPFVERRAKALLKNYDDMIALYHDEFWRIMAEYAQVKSADKHAILLKKKVAFKAMLSHEVGVANAKATVFLEDMAKHLSSETLRRMEAVRAMTYLDVMEQIVGEE